MVWVDVGDVDHPKVFQVLVDPRDSLGLDYLGKSALPTVQEYVEVVVYGQADGRYVSESGRHH